MAEPVDTADLGLGRLGRSSGMTMFRQGLAMFIAFVSSVLLARVLGPEGRGQFSVALLLPTTAVIASGLGLGPATVYHVARGLCTPSDAVRNVLTIGALLSLLSMAACVLLVRVAGSALFPGVPAPVLYASVLYIPTGILNVYLMATLQGLQDFRAYNANGLVGQLASLGLTFVFVWGFGLGVGGALYALALGNVVAVIASLWRLWPYLTIPHSVSPYRYMRALLPYGFASYVNHGVDWAARHIDLFLVNLFLDPGQAGIYVLATALTERLYTVASAPAIVSLPRISELEGSDHIRDRLTPLIARHVLWTTLAISLLALAVATVFVVMLYGPEYSSTATVFRLMLPGTVMVSLTRVLASDIAGRGRPQVNARISLANLGAIAVLDALLIPIMGTLGAALGMTVAATVAMLVTLAYYCRSYHVPCRSVLVLTREDLARLRRLIRAQVLGRLRRRPTEEIS